VRPLTKDDLACLREKRVGAPRLARFRETHHRLARFVASGLRDAEVLRLTGYSGTRLSSLKQDPSFQQLVAEYRGKVDQAWIDSQDEFYSTATSNMLRLERMVEEHLDQADEDGELIPLKTIGPLIADRADRFGYGKHSTQTNEVYDFASMMAQMAARSGRSNVIDAKAQLPAIPAASASPPEVAEPPQPPLPQGNSFAAPGFRRRI
jgi:hypothetical protein